MARSRLFKNPLCWCLGMLSHDSHRDDHDSGDAKENGNKITEKENDKSDKMAHRKSGPNVGFGERNPNLCRTCRKVDFNSLFRSHDCELFAIGSLDRFEGHRRFCRCRQELISCTNRLRSPQLAYKGLLGKLDSHAPACSFCAFLYQCQVRLNLIPAKEEQWYCIIKPCPSLESITRCALFMRSLSLLRYVQDVAALQMCKVQRTRSGRMLETSPMPQPILRVADSNSKTLTRNKDASGGFLGRKLDPNKVNLSLIGEWLTLCQSTHSHCEDVDVGRVPGLLVIDCITGYIIPVPFEQNTADQIAKYVTLSYLWGTAEATGRSAVQPINRDGWKGLALPTLVPLVISDAIQVVKQLGYRYLWVDRYCIPQDDRAAKHIQIRNMGRISSNSSLTIISAAGDGPEYGLPGVSSRSRIEQVGVQINDKISLVLYKPPTNHIANSKWNTRGWTYQEGLLSKRRLVFTDLMVYFQCQEMHGDEVLSLPIPELGEHCDEIRPLLPEEIDIGMVFPKVTDWNNPVTIWKRISDYGPRDLGYDSDALNVISGVMEMYALGAGNSLFKLFCGLPILPIRLWEKSWPVNMKRRTWAFSFRTWIEGAGAFEGASKAQRPKDNDVTSSLAYSLCWRHEWDESSKLPANFERARRKVFGSWTMAGWRTKKSEPDEIELYDSCLRISVQYSGERLLNWEGDNPRILELSRNGTVPLSFNIRGVVVDVRVEWKRYQVGYGSGKWIEGWVLTSPFTSERNLLGSPRWLFEEAASGHGDSSKLLFLILGGRYDKNWLLPPKFVGMILRPVTRLLDGEACTFYEKLDSYSFRFNNDDWPRLATCTREMEVRLV